MNLLNRTDGAFRNMVEVTGRFDELYERAAKAGRPEGSKQGTSAEPKGSKQGNKATAGESKQGNKAKAETTKSKKGKKP